jgi:hypothetical protein
MRKAFKEDVLRTDAAGVCGLSLVRCGELAHATLGKDSPLIKRMKEISKVSNVGSKIAAGVFNQAIDDQRLLVGNTPAAKAVKSTLELCKPSLTHLFGNDDSRVDKALEAAKFSQYQAPPYRSKTPSFFRFSGSQEGRDRKKKPYKRPYKSSYQKDRSSGKANGPASKKGEGRKKK